MTHTTDTEKLYDGVKRILPPSGEDDHFNAEEFSYRARPLQFLFEGAVEQHETVECPHLGDVVEHHRVDPGVGEVPLALLIHLETEPTKKSPNFITSAPYFFS